MQDISIVDVVTAADIVVAGAAVLILMLLLSILTLSLKGLMLHGIGIKLELLHAVWNWLKLCLGFCRKNDLGLGLRIGLIWL